MCLFRVQQVETDFCHKVKLEESSFYVKKPGYVSPPAA